MTAGKMHDDEIDTSISLVTCLLAQQFPHWANLHIEPVRSAGTDNALYRLGDEMVVRLPRIHWAVDQIDKEQEWLPRLAPHLPVAVPAQLAKGKPGEGYPWDWSICRWVDGENMTFEGLADPCRAAEDVAHFIGALQRIDTTGGPTPATHNLSRGKPLATRDAQTREAIAALRGTIDTDAATAAWEAALEAAEWNHPPVWFHGDMLPGNLLFKQDRLSGVIDFGTLGVGDPACDLMIAWSLFAGESREVFRATLAVDDATWARGRGWALSQALIFIPYYVNTNPVGVACARHAIDEVLAGYRASDRMGR